MYYLRMEWRRTRRPVDERSSRRTFASLNVGEYRLLFIAGVLTFTAVQAQQVARGQLAYDLTGSNKGLGGVYLGFGLPLLILTPIGGVLADRLPKRPAMFVSQIIIVVPAAWIAVADVTDTIEYWMLIAASALQSIGFAVYGPARVAYTGEVVPRGLFANAMALTQMGANGARVVAPAIAGALVAVEYVGTAGVYVLTTLVLSLSCWVTFRLPHRDAPRLEQKSTVYEEFAGGVHYVRHRPLLRLLIITSLAMVMVGLPYLAFLPSLSSGVFDKGAVGLGLLTSVGAIAAVVVTVLIASRVDGQRAWWVQSVCGVGLALGLVAVAVSPTFPLALVAVFLVGGGAAGYQTMNNTIALSLAESAFHGRVQSLLSLGFTGFALVALPLGIVADIIGLRTTLALMGGVCLVTMLIYMAAQERYVRRGGSLRMEPLTEATGEPPNPTTSADRFEPIGAGGRLAGGRLAVTMAPSGRTAVDSGEREHVSCRSLS